ncbi:MAG: signal recognition particle protein Srp19 [Candidatus Hecatellaceae archaeon]
MRKLPGKIIVWPPYFDASKSRREGRKLPRRLCVPTPHLSEIVRAAELLGLNPQFKPEARYPRSWWVESGYVVVDKLKSKQETLRRIAEKLAELRGEHRAGNL